MSLPEVSRLRLPIREIRFAHLAQTICEMLRNEAGSKEAGFFSAKWLRTKRPDLHLRSAGLSSFPRFPGVVLGNPPNKPETATALSWFFRNFQDMQCQFQGPKGPIYRSIQNYYPRNSIFPNELGAG